MPQTKRQQQKEFTRQKIIDTAFRMYAVTGFSTSTNAIAQEAEISHGAIFAHFPTREILQITVIEQFAHEVGEKLHNLSGSSSNIAELLHAHIRIIEGYEPFYKKMISEFSTLPQEAMALLVSVQSIISYHFGIVIEREQKKETVKNILLHMLFNTWIGLLHYYLQNSELFAPGASVLKKCKDELIDSFVRLISNQA